MLWLYDSVAAISLYKLAACVAEAHQWEDIHIHGAATNSPPCPLIPSCSWYSTLPYTHHCGTMGTKSKTETFCYHMHINLGILRSSWIFKMLTMWQSHGPITMIHHLCHCTSSLHSMIGPLTISRSTVCGGPWDHRNSIHELIHHYQTVPHAQTDTQPIQQLACKYVTNIKATPAHYQYTFVTQCWLRTGTLPPGHSPRSRYTYASCLSVITMLYEAIVIVQP